MLQYQALAPVRDGVLPCLSHRFLQFPKGHHHKLLVFEEALELGIPDHFQVRLTPGSAPVRVAGGGAAVFGVVK
jgi:hypothetical protein